MNQKSSIIILIISVFKVALSQYGCGVNEIFTLTINPCNTCDYRDWCPQDLGPGCDCFPGYLRNSLGICVPPESCEAFPLSEIPYDYPVRPEVYRPLPRPQPIPPPPALPPPLPPPPPPVPRCRGRFEEYRECGSACPPTCEDRSRFCPSVCVAGCFCRRGYIRNSQRICVRPDQCPRVPAAPPRRCGPNEEYRPCGSACPSTCENLGGGEPCTLQCVPGCFCTGRLVRKDRKCVDPSECGVVPRRYPPPPPPLYSPPVRPPPYVPALKPPSPPLPPPPPHPPTLPLPPPKAAYPPPAPAPPVAPPPPPVPPPPSECGGCPNRSKCNKCCKSAGYAIGFCVGNNFSQCNCLG